MPIKTKRIKLDHNKYKPWITQSIYMASEACMYAVIKGVEASPAPKPCFVLICFIIDYF